MSFSAEVKNELSGKIPQARHCMLAELAVLFLMLGQVGESGDGRYYIGVDSENAEVLRKIFTLLKKTFNIDSWEDLSKEQFEEITQGLGNLGETVDKKLIKNSCCKRAYLRGAFLACGSVNDPNKGYHLEFTCNNAKWAEQIADVLEGFGIQPGITVRSGKYHVVYIKEGESLVDALNIFEAHKALMEFENIRIIKDMRNSINRAVNCEVANSNKTITASQNQLEDIRYLRDNGLFGRLTPTLEEMANMRLTYPDLTLKELGEKFNPPIGKSGVNHRLRRLSELARGFKEN